MIQITNKPQNPPEILYQRGEHRGRNKLEVATETLVAAYKNEERDFEFDASLYGHKDIKEALEAAQNGKCCFCEAKVKHIVIFNLLPNILP